jgi:NAD(P)-dependent dehydrogenase (short-subunit alcohol dehydrogenase family)
MVILVSGASYGLGFELVRLGLEQGHEMIAGIRLADGRGPLDGLPEASRARLHVVLLDVTDEAEVERAAATVADLVPAVDALVNVAGVIHRRYETDQPVRDIPMAEVERLFDVNVFGAMRVVKHFLPLVLASPRPRILNVTSEAGGLQDYADTYDPYYFSKATMNLVSFRMGNVLGGAAKVLAIHPGRMRTHMSQGRGEILPEESAAGILALATGAIEPAPDLWFVDYHGEAMRT